MLLGHRRLAILDLSDNASQPLTRDSLTITYNGELYNFQELRAQLEQRGVRFESSGDTEVVLRAYQQWGAACLAHFNGIFAFAIWDSAHSELFSGSRSPGGEAALLRAGRAQPVFRFRLGFRPYAAMFRAGHSVSPGGEGG